MIKDVSLRAYYTNACFEVTWNTVSMLHRNILKIFSDIFWLLSYPISQIKLVWLETRNNIDQTVDQDQIV